jgi:HEAT repeat protein
MTTEANQQLHQAASDGNLSRVDEALANGADVNARGSYGDTALNEAAESGHLEVVKRLVEAGADIHNVGGADKTPVMNAAFAGHVETVRFLLEKGAQVNDDLLSSVQLKVNILEENAEGGMVNPEAVEAWKGFLDFLVTARLRQDLPEILNGLSADDPHERKPALERVESAAYRGVDISAAAPRLLALAADPDPETRRTASAALCAYSVRAQEWDRIRELCETGDGEAKAGAISVIVSAARGGFDVLPLAPTIVNLLSESALNLRHDAAIALGYAATHGVDVSDAVPEIVKLLSDPAPEARKMGAWALYRIAKYLGGIPAAIPALRALLSDDDEGVRDMAAETLSMAEAQEQGTESD